MIIQIFSFQPDFFFFSKSEDQGSISRTFLEQRILVLPHQFLHVCMRPHDTWSHRAAQGLTFANFRTNFLQRVAYMTFWFKNVKSLIGASTDHRPSDEKFWRWHGAQTDISGKKHRDPQLTLRCWFLTKDTLALSTFLDPTAPVVWCTLASPYPVFENFDDDEDVDVDKRDDDHADGSEGAGENVAASDLISRLLWLLVSDDDDQNEDGRS